MTTSANLIAQKYVQLALAIEPHIPGFVDAYFGPPEWKDQAGVKPVTELVSESSGLATAVAGDTAMDSQRRDFLTRHVRAMQTSLRLRHGEQMALAEETEALYDITPEWVAEAIFQEAHQTLDELLPAGSSLIERMTARKKATEVPTELARSLLHEIIAELRRLTRAYDLLPLAESFELQLVTDQPWRGYNWYLGNYHSRIDINTDLPLQITDLTDLMAHEGYPGHHTELSIKEERLVRQKGHLEQSIVLISSPASVVSEGIATCALSIIMTEEEQIAWLAKLCQRSGFGHLNAEREHKIDTARRQLWGVRGNAAFLLHDQGAGEDEVGAYFREYELLTAAEAAKMVERLSDPFLRSYIFTYHYGRELLEALFARQDDHKHWFTRLLTEPVTPSQIRTWTEGSS
jgi:hypothetical protein